MAYEIKAPAAVPSSISKMDGITKVFTAGSIEMGKAEPWQDKLVKKYENNDSVLFLNPRRSDWDDSWIQDPTPGTQFHTQVSWELDHIGISDIVVFYFDPKTQSPITLLELGLALGTGDNVIVCCPDGYFRKGNVVITCATYGVSVLNTFDELTEELDTQLFDL
jgi:hypothetical protein